MTMLSTVPGSIPVARTDAESPRAVALFCLLGLVASFWLMALGMDLGAALV
jgi:hypothetical protein